MVERRKFLPGTEEVFPSKNDGVEIERRMNDEVWISTEVRDASGLGDIVRADGGDFTDYMKNPVIFWDHGFRLDLPIARAPEMPRVVNDGGVKKIMARIDWVPYGQSFEIDAIHRLWDGKFINAVSIRFLISKALPLPGHEKDWWPPLDIQEWVLREFSIVGVPANQDALRKSAQWLMSNKQLRRQKHRERMRRMSNAEFPEGNERSVLLPLSDCVELQELNQVTQKILEKLNHGR